MQVLIADLEEEHDKIGPQQETLETNIFEMYKADDTEPELTSSERSANAVEEIMTAFEADVKKAHQAYEIDPELDRINLSMEDGPGVSRSRSVNSGMLSD